MAGNDWLLSAVDDTMECVRLHSRLNGVETTNPHTNVRKAAARARCDRNNRRRTCTNETFLFCVSIPSARLLSFVSNVITLSGFSTVLDLSLLALLPSMIRNPKAKSKTATMMPKMKGPRKPKRVYSPPPTGGPTSALEMNYGLVRGNKPHSTRTRDKVLTSQYRVVLGLELDSGEGNRDYSLPISSGGVSSHLRGGK